MQAGSAGTIVQVLVDLAVVATAVALCALVVLWRRTSLRTAHRLIRLEERLSRELGDMAKTLSAADERLHETHADDVARVQARLALVLKTVEDSGRLTRSQARSHAQQVVASQSLFAALPVRALMPASGGWAASPDLLHQLVLLIQEHRPRLVVECGSGLSTLWSSYALESTGGRVVSLDHDASFAAQTRERLVTHRLDQVAQVRDAPLEPHEVGTTTWQWYAKDAWQDLSDIDVLFVDGPPTSVGPLARYPALPLLRDRLAPGAIILLDDTVRDDEQEIVRQWTEMLPGAEVTHLSFDKGATVIRLPKSSPAAAG